MKVLRYLEGRLLGLANDPKNPHLISSLTRPSSPFSRLASLSSRALLAATSPTKNGSSSGRTRCFSSSSMRSSTIRFRFSNDDAELSAALARRWATEW